MTHSRNTSASSALADNANRRKSPRSPIVPVYSDEQRDHLDVIAYTETSIVGDENVEQISQNSIRDCMKSADYGGTYERVAYGNPRGLELLDDHETMKRENSALTSRVEKLEEERQEVNKKFEEVNKRFEEQGLEIRQLKLASEGYRKIRHRFIDVFVRDILRVADARTRDRISVGNVAAHEGDCVVDASLYVNAERKDVRSFTHIYGVQHDVVLQLSEAKDEKSLKTINKFATVNLSELNAGRRIPDTLRSAYETFIENVSFNIGEDVADVSTVLGQSYFTAWSKLNELK